VTSFQQVQVSKWVYDGFRLLEFVAKWRKVVYGWKIWWYYLL